MSGNLSNEKEDTSWLGKKGFDEARYYNSEKVEIGIEHSDETIKQKVLESFKRNPILLMTEIKVDVKDGLVILSGQVQGPLERKEASDSIQGLTGVKAVKNLLEF